MLAQIVWRERERESGRKQTLKLQHWMDEFYGQVIDDKYESNEEREKITNQRPTNSFIRIDVGIYSKSVQVNSEKRYYFNLPFTARYLLIFSAYDELCVSLCVLWNLHPSFQFSWLRECWMSDIIISNYGCFCTRRCDKHLQSHNMIWRSGGESMQSQRSYNTKFPMTFCR